MAKALEIPAVDAPVIIVGSGAAGLVCALALAQKPDLTPILVLTKTSVPAGGSTLLAQGGIAAALGVGDSAERHGEDTLKSGAGLSDPARVRQLVWEGIPAVQGLIAQGFPVDRNERDELKLGREAAHSLPRILHAGGDSTGRALVQTLLTQVAQTSSIELVTDCIATELLLEDGKISGLIAYRKDAGWIHYRAGEVVLATGGCGALWQETTNAPEATGDGLALASRAGAELSDLEFMQFHPTALLPKRPIGGRRLDLMTEALRGAGARLLDGDGTAFMTAEHPLGDLAPRDVVARAIGQRRRKGERVTLDLRPAFERAGEQAFPQCMALCRAAGYEPANEPVPVTPAAHYHMGGVRTDADGRSSVPGLWACGEAAATGVHGANRLASNSLLESLVFARRASAAIRRKVDEQTDAPKLFLVRPSKVPTNWAGERTKLAEEVRSVMSRHAGLIRDPQGLSEAALVLGTLQAELDVLRYTSQHADQPDFEALRSWSELRNMLLAARLVVRAALSRTESRGAHFRSDRPASHPDWARHQVLTITDLA